MTWLSAIAALVLVMPLAVAFDWPDGAYNPYGHNPILVFEDDTPLTADLIPYERSVDNAMRYWEAGGNGHLKWNPKFSPSTRTQADIIVTFVDASEVACAPSEFGAGCGGMGNPGTASLALRDASTGGYLPYMSVEETAKHELGHSLGLPHSKDPKDIMFPQGHRVGGDAPGLLERLHWTLLAVIVAAGAWGGVAAYGRWRAYRLHRKLDYWTNKKLRP